MNLINHFNNYYNYDQVIKYSRPSQCRRLSIKTNSGFRLKLLKFEARVVQLRNKPLLENKTKTGIPKGYLQ